ncbi:MAG: phosphatase PAP2 family protein [Adhaeribacter sp.]
MKKILALFALIGAELIILGGIAFVCIFLFLLMAKLVFLDQNQTFDMAAFAFAKKQTSPAVTAFMQFVTFFASKDFLIYGSLTLAFIFFFIKKHRWYAVKIPVIAAGSSLLNQGLKFWFDRPRPETAFFEQSGFSFPSGHAMIGGTFYGLFIYLVWTNVKSVLWRWVFTLLLCFWIILIGYSRVYLNVHYASDVLAGWSAGLIFLIIALMVLRKFEPAYARKATEVMQEATAEENKSLKDV